MFFRENCEKFAAIFDSTPSVVMVIVWGPFVKRNHKNACVLQNYAGPGATKQQWSKIQELINKGIEEGAKVIAGGSGKSEGLDGGFYLESAIFADVTNDMTIEQEEIFRPVFV